ncbi:MAG TPA: sigma-70 family RNA polymerase sigma factor [Thermomicrobiales bacterium]|nr:sigma-70 family RNA polymerase sigma factor [Thermomicrobiales bacterium]
MRPPRPRSAPPSTTPRPPRTSTRAGPSRSTATACAVSNHRRPEDATSRTFERVLRSLPDYRVDVTRPGATFRAWLFAIAHNTVVDHHRRRRFHLSLDRLLHPLRNRPAFDPPDPDRAPDDAAISRDEGRAVWIALGHLPERQRRVVELRLAGLTGPEIATAQNMTLPAVKSVQFRAYQTMREVVTELGYAPDARRTPGG